MTPDICPKCGSSPWSGGGHWHCTSYIESGRFTQADKCRIRELTAALDAANKRIAELEKLLRPFAIVTQDIDRPNYHDLWPFYDALSDAGSLSIDFTIGHGRKARAALESTHDHEAS